MHFNIDFLMIHLHLNAEPAWLVVVAGIFSAVALTGALARDVRVFGFGAIPAAVSSLLLSILNKPTQV